MIVACETGQTSLISAFVNVHSLALRLDYILANVPKFPLALGLQLFTPIIMRFSIIPAVLCGLASVVHAIPFATPIEDAKFELMSEVKTLFETRFAAKDREAFSNIIQKRDTTLTVESLLNVVNSSGIIFDVLDLVAYNPLRIERLANWTADAIGNVNLSSLSSMTSSSPLSVVAKALNISLIYNDVRDSGVVSSLLDGILLDEDFRPVLVNLTGRVMEGNKNLFLYLVQDIFRPSKRDNVDIHKRATSGLETFVTNIIASALGSKLVSGIASDILTALNDTQFLTTTAKQLIANEGYQNMTAQFVIDIMRTNLTIDTQAINITRYAELALRNPTHILSLTSQLLSGKINFAGAGKYGDALSAIIRDVESNGVFADLNNYVFSESHSVSKPLIPTGNIVVAKTDAYATVTGNRSVSSTTRSRAISTNTPTSTSISSSAGSDSSNSGSSDSDSAAEVASILALLGASTAEGLSSVRSSSRSTSRPASSASSSFDINALLSQLSASETLTTEEASASGDSGLLALLAGISNTQNRAVEASSGAANTALLLSTANAAGHHNNLVTKCLVYAQAFFLGGALLL